MKRPWTVVALVMALGLAGTAVALASREGDPQFTAAQQSLLPVGAAQLQRLILTTSDPRPGYGGRARAARCTTRAGGGLGNPWSCAVRYPRAPRVRYRVSVYPDRSIYGSGEPEGAPLHGALIVRGCCVTQTP
ncbi:MAG TPA: hypothetical protein VID29_06445 [Solirubrobacteraceae bacterium]|jgi:hypothetical protein